MTDNVDGLREIFLDVAGTETVTDEQRDVPSHDPVEATGRVTEVVGDIAADHGIDTRFDDGELAEIVRGYFDDESDAEIARRLGEKSLDKSVARARVSLHLFRDSDFDAPFSIDRLEGLLDSEATTGEMAERLGVAPSTVRAYKRAVVHRRHALNADSDYSDRLRAAVSAPAEEPSSVTPYDGLGDALDNPESG